ncbi:MAG: host attachment protein [Hyphomicrobiaceae bacterium]
MGALKRTWIVVCSNTAARILRWSADEDGLAPVAQVAVACGDPAALPRALSDTLLPCLAEHKFARLILVAPSASLNRLMSDLPATLSNVVVVEVCQDMMEASSGEIHAAVRDA